MQTAQTSHTPAELELVIDFVNTVDLEEGTDALATAQELAGWLSSHGLLGADAATPREADRTRAIELREALRSLMLQNNGGAPDEGAGRELEQTARRGDLAVRFGAGGSISLAPGKEGVAGALAQLLVPVAQAITDGSWQRVKACRDSGCHWAFYDHSRNRSGVWCDMAVCGNRTKVRAYRQRTPRSAG